MPGVSKRPSDKGRGKAGRHTIWWVDEHGKRRTRAAFTSQAESLALARKLDEEARKVRLGLTAPGDALLKATLARPAAELLAEYHADLVARRITANHARDTTHATARLLEAAGARTLGDLDPVKVQAALADLLARRSVSTANHALRSIRAWLRWLEITGRLAEVPRGLRAIKPYPAHAGPRRQRRALTPGEVARLLTAAESVGADRVMLYRVALGTGFRAAELRSLVPESFALEGPDPTIRLQAQHSKRRKADVQPIRRDLAGILRPWLAGKPPSKPVFAVARNSARMLRLDLDAAGIPYRDKQGRVADFHALRYTYVTNLVKRGVNPKMAQKLARHSTITLTMDIYTQLDEGDTRRALEDD